MEKLLELDGQLLLWLREVCVRPALDPCMTLISRLGDGGFLWIAIGALFLLLGIRNRVWLRRGALVLLSLGANAVVCNVILKPLCGRTRPYDLLGYAIQIPPLADASFPSGHTSAAFAAATALYAIDRRWGVAAYLAAAWMGFSRLYLGVHFPLDVIVGAGIGVIMAKIVILCVERFFPTQKAIK